MTSTAHSDWFAPESVGYGFIGERARMHICRIRAVAPNAVELAALCGASEPTVASNPSLDPADQQACRSWWESKIRIEVGHSIDKSLRGGLAKPRVCGDCRAIHDGGAT